MQKGTNTKETFTLKVKQDIISNIDKNDGLIFVLCLALQNDIEVCEDSFKFSCNNDDFIFYKDMFCKLKYLTYVTHKNKVTIELDKKTLYNYVCIDKEDVKTSIIDYIKSTKIREYIKYNFILYGSILNPTNYYHIELKMSDNINCNYFIGFASKFELNFKYINRKNGNYIYLKEAEQIADFLRIVGANNHLLEFENLRIFKEVRNDINRKQNCEIANLNKVIGTAVRQENAILYIKETVGLDYLKDELKEVALIRLETENLTLQEIGDLTNPKISKHTVNYRLKKVINISEKLRRQKNG